MKMSFTKHGGWGFDREKLLSSHDVVFKRRFPTLLSGFRSETAIPGVLSGRKTNGFGFGSIKPTFGTDRPMKIVNSARWNAKKLPFAGAAPI
jgi:hypothetical protein